jgi:hypothetical protein
MEVSRSGRAIQSVLIVALLSIQAAALGQPSGARTQQQRDEDAAAACAACGGCGVVGIGIVLAAIALNIALLIWVARDAKSRGMDSAVLWMLLVAFTGPIGLLIYFFSRPQGQIGRCPHCGNARLVASAKCPHCGNA